MPSQTAGTDVTDRELHEHLIGRHGSRHDLNTPVLVLDLEALKRNIAKMADFVAAKAIGLRPHAKTHKSVDIARLQMAAGAIGQCCAKLGEAEALAAGGVSGLLITSPVVPHAAIERLVTLNKRSDGLMVVIDNPDNARAIAAAIDDAAGPDLAVLIDIDPGIRRTGVTSADKAVELFQTIAALPRLRYCGVQYYCGSLQHVANFAERQTAMQERAHHLSAIIAALSNAGGSPRIVTGGGTGTHRIDAEIGLFTELQAGSYIFMDDQYRVCDLSGDLGDAEPFETALMIDATVISANSVDMVTLDAGYKAMATDAGPPTVVDGAGANARYLFMGDEHGALVGDTGLKLGDRVSLRTPHCDPTVNLYDHYHVVRGQTLEAIWAVSGRGRSR